MADVSVDGVRFNVVQLGPPEDVVRTCPPVVFIHGLIMDDLSSFYFTLAPPAARGTDVLCYDLRGHGLSERPPHGYRLEDAVDDLCGILDAVGFTEPVQLVGNSFGGTIALSAALWAPERVASLVLIEANPAFVGWGNTIVEDLEDLVEGFDGPGIRGYIAADAPRKLRKMVDRCEELVTKTSLADDLRASRPTTLEGVAAVSCPTFLLYGDASDILDHGLTLEEFLPENELEIIEGCSHALLMEAPDEAAARVVPWLLDPDRARPREPAR